MTAEFHGIPPPCRPPSREVLTIMLCEDQLLLNFIVSPMGKGREKKVQLPPSPLVVTQEETT